MIRYRVQKLRQRHGGNNRLETIFANSVFEQPWWLDIVARDNWKEAVVMDGDKVIARLPYVIEKNAVKMPLYTQTLGIWMDESLRNFSSGNEQFHRQKEIIHSLLEQIPYKQIDLVLDHAQEYVLPFRWEGFSIEPTFSYRISNVKELDSVRANFSRNVKRKLNKGRRVLSIVYGREYIDEFIRLQNCTYARQNRKNPVDNELTRRVITEAMDAGHGIIFIARDEEGRSHAGSFVLYDEKVTYHLMSGQDTTFGNDCAMPVLFEKEIEFAAEHSLDFDFEGSMVEGIEQVYRRYGGQQIINWHVSRLNLANDIKNILKPRIKRIIGYKI